MTSLRVLAAMSGGVDSAVAAARAADAGHDVTGIHLALSANPQSYRTGARGCCTLEDARDARRAADVIGIPFYVWDLAERFHRDVVEDFVAEYAARRGLAVAAKPDSHDVCFIADGDTKGFLARRLGPAPGQIVDASGAVLGE